MQNAQKKGWETLTKDEQQALSLIVVSNRSRKEASIIMNISPYKFNEIYLRARKFFITFAAHYEHAETILPSGVTIKPEFRLFVQLLLSKRKKPMSILETPGFLSIINNKVRRQLWMDLFQQLDWGEYTENRDLLQEFDRWNNFRVLPKALRLPAAFPRRRNRDLKKIHDSLIAISDLGWNLIEKQYGTNTPPMAHIPVVELSYFGIKTVKKTERNKDYFTDNVIPIFEKKEEAERFSGLIFDYSNIKRKSPHAARKFWANFRLMLQKALNYKELLNIQNLDMDEISVKDREFLKSVETPRPRPARRSSSKIFW